MTRQRQGVGGAPGGLVCGSADHAGQGGPERLQPPLQSSAVFRKDILASFCTGYRGAEPPVNPELEEERWQVLEIVDEVLVAGNFTNVSSEALRVRLTTLGLIASRSSQAGLL